MNNTNDNVGVIDHSGKTTVKNVSLNKATAKANGENSDGKNIKSNGEYVWVVVVLNMTNGKKG